MREIVNGIFHVMRGAAPSVRCGAKSAEVVLHRRGPGCSPDAVRARGRARPVRDLPSPARGLSVQSAHRRARRRTSGRSSPTAASRSAASAFIQCVFADSGHAGEKVAKATLIAVEIVRKNPAQVGFAVNPRRRVVERFFAWIGCNRRLAKDFEATIDSARAFLYAASVMLLVRAASR